MIVVMTDDQTVEQMRAMPIVSQKFATSGTQFPNSIVTYPLCCPSRASFFTGQHGHNHGVRFNFGKDGGFSSFKNQDTTMPASLQAAGYRTSHIGKYLNGYPGPDEKDWDLVPPGFDNWQGLIDPSTGQFYNYSMNDNGEVVTYGEDDADYQTDVLTALAIDDIREADDEGDPFFLSLSYLAPHAQFGYPLDSENKAALDADAIKVATSRNFEFFEPLAAPRHEGLFEGEPIPVNPNFNRPTEYPEVESGFIRPQLTPGERVKMTSNYRAELESLLAVDEGVGKILDELDALDLADETVVVFTSDNGFLHGEHANLFGKYTPWQEVLRVPLLFRGPGIPEGKKNSTLVSNLDLVATLHDLAEAKPLRTIDGFSLAPFLFKGKQDPDRLVLIEGLGRGLDNNQPNPWFGVMSKTHTYARSPDGTRESFFDLKKDPFELNNLALNVAQGGDDALEPPVRDTPAKTRSKLSAKTKRLLDEYRAAAKQLRLCSGQECNGLL